MHKTQQQLIDEHKKKQIDSFLQILKEQHVDGEFARICLKCGSLNIEESFDGEGAPICRNAYTASFDGQHFIKCLYCGNAKTINFEVDMNGAFQT